MKHDDYTLAGGRSHNVHCVNTTKKELIDTTNALVKILQKDLRMSFHRKDTFTQQVFIRDAELVLNKLKSAISFWRDVVELQNDEK